MWPLTKLRNELTSLTSVWACVDTGLGAAEECLAFPEGCLCQWFQTSCTLLCTARALPNSGLSNRVCTAAIWPSKPEYPPKPWLKLFFFSWCCNRCRAATSSPYPATMVHNYSHGKCGWVILYKVISCLALTLCGTYVTPQHLGHSVSTVTSVLKIKQAVTAAFSGAHLFQRGIIISLDLRFC